MESDVGSIQENQIKLQRRRQNRESFFFLRSPKITRHVLNENLIIKAKRCLKVTQSFLRICFVSILISSFVSERNSC